MDGQRQVSYSKTDVCGDHQGQGGSIHSEARFALHLRSVDGYSSPSTTAYDRRQLQRAGPTHNNQCPVSHHASCR